MADALLILSSNKCPDDDAGAVRQHALARAFTEVGYKVIAVGLGESTKFAEKEYEGVSYVSLRSQSKSFFLRLGNLVFYKSRLCSYIQRQRISPVAILVVDIPFPALFYIKRYAKMHSIKLFHDSVEWYSKEEFSHGVWDVRYILKNRYNTKWIDTNFSVISISTFLKNHFESRGIRSIRIPTIFDVLNTTCEKHTDANKLTLLYAGSPGRKDYLSIMLDGLSMLGQSEIDAFRFNIFGATRNQILAVSPETASSLEKLGNNVSFFGRVPREIVKERLEEADFTVLLRPENMRYAKAGFPTKFAESMTAATPVICNLTSDLGMYIEDGENGIIVKDCTAGSFSEAVRKALTLSTEKKKAMYTAARKTAEDKFDYRLYVDILSSLIGE